MKLLFAQLVVCIQFALGAVFTMAQDATILRDTLTAGGVSAVFPDDTTYANASSPYNLRFHFKPFAIAYPTNASQVSTAIKAGSAQNLRVVARSGGHSYIANGLGGKDGSLVVDLSKLKKLTYDSATKNVVIETGYRLGDIALALNEYGRALPHGRCTYVGIGGHAGFGGFGFISRMWGLTLDTVQSVNLVLADGTITTASAAENTELFWAVRGSSASFGIVTSIQFKTFAAPSSVTIFQYNWAFDVDTATSALSDWQDFTDSGIPKELGGEVVLTRGATSGNVGFQFFGAYYGPVESFNATIAPYLTKLGPHNSETVTSGNWLVGLEALVYGNLNTSTAAQYTDTFYAKSVLTPEAAPMTRTAMNAFINYLATDGFTFEGSWFVEVELYGGSNSAINAVPLDATAFAHRSSRFNLQLYASSANGLPPYPASGFTFVDGMQNSIVSNMPANWDYGAYVNYADDRLADWQQKYYASHYKRLEALKTVLDPKDVFEFPTSIEEL